MLEPHKTNIMGMCCRVCAVKLTPIDDAKSTELLHSIKAVEQQVVDGFLVEGLRRWHRGLSHADRRPIVQRYEIRSAADFVLPRPILIEIASTLEDGSLFITLGVMDRREVMVLAAYLEQNEVTSSPTCH